MGDYQIDLKFIILLIFKRLALIRMIINFKSILIYLSYNDLLTGNFFRGIMVWEQNLQVGLGIIMAYQSKEKRNLSMGF